MTAEEVMKVLEKANKPLCRKEIYNSLKKNGWTEQRITQVLRRLVHSKEIKYEELPYEEAIMISPTARNGIRVYYLK